jgi:endonuclease III
VTPNQKKIIAGLKKAYPRATCALDHRNPLQLLLATILSAQCTDARVNMVTPVLFKRFPTAQALAKAPLPEVEGIVRSTGFFRQKARSLVLTARELVEKHGGRVPKTMEELLTLRGVARKTANVVLGTGYGIPAGVVVDTHVRRLSNRLGFTRNDDPVKIERDLMKGVPESDWIWFSHALITHGRRVCRAPVPLCGSCSVRKWCPFPSKTDRVLA